MQKVIYTNEKGLSIEITNSRPFMLQQIEGTGAIETDVQMQKAPFQDGATYIDSMLEPRYLTLTIMIFADTQQQLYQYRQNISKVFNPKLKGTIRYKNDYTEKELPVVVERAPVWGETRPNLQQGMISIVAPNPFWLDLKQQNYKLEDFVGNFRFPFSFPIRFASRGDFRVLENKGDVTTPIKVTFRGPATNPKITNEDTGEFIKVNREINEGENLVITTEFGNKTVKIINLQGVETNAFNFIDLNSSFFQLDVGENRISFITEGGSPEVFIEYKNRYVGV